MKKITSYRYTQNNRELAVFYLTPAQIKKRKINKEDCIALMFDAQRGEDETHTLYIRPDEALVIAELLICAVRSITKAYNCKFKKYSLNK
jgi:hypothetical protein